MSEYHDPQSKFALTPCTSLPIVMIHHLKATGIIFGQSPGENAERYRSANAYQPPSFIESAQLLPPLPSAPKLSIDASVQLIKSRKLLL